jgi:hypothetical protein
MPRTYREITKCVPGPGEKEETDSKTDKESPWRPGTSDRNFRNRIVVDERLTFPFVRHLQAMGQRRGTASFYRCLG